MRNQPNVRRSRLLGRAALAATIAAAVAGCSEASRFGTPLFTGSTENQREIIGDNQSMPQQPVATAAVTRSELPPPGGSRMPPAGSATASAAEPGLPPGDYVWTPHGVKPSVSATTVSYAPTSSQPPRASQSAGGVHVVAAGETLYRIGLRYGVPPTEIASLNGVAPENIRVGQRLKIPGAGGSMVASRSEPPQTSAPKVVASNGANSGVLTPPANVRPAQNPPAAASTPQPPVAPRTVGTAPAIPSIPVEKKSDTPPATPASTTTAVDDVVEPASADGTSFRWPVRGRIISGFGAKPNGEKNDGINLAVPEGTTVKAAEAGTVIYAGNELEGYGNLVLIRHADDWVSAYAHNSDIKVKRGDTVRRGQTVATAGMSGSVPSPQVHFELRKKAKPVNPLDYLAGA